MAKRNEKGSLFLLAALAAAVFLLAGQVKPAAAAGYNVTLQAAVREVVQSHLDKDKRLGPGLIRLVFHDCFVNGCDASVLLLKTPFNGTGGTEKDSGSNTGLRGMQVIDAIKDKLGVTCTDAVFYAAHEAIYILSNGNIAYDLDGPGRKDGITSSSDDPAKFLPNPTDDFEELFKKFDAKKLTKEDVVVLSGAHAVGIAQPSSVTPGGKNLMYQAAIAPELLTNEVKNNIRDMKKSTVEKSGYQRNNVNMSAVGILDNSFYNAVLQKMVLFGSDAALEKDAAARKNVELYQKEPKTWNKLFGYAMAKLSKLPAEGALSETRVKCSETNKMQYP